MKLVLYTQVFSPSVGGVETHVATLAQMSTRKDGTQLTVVTQTPAHEAGDASYPFPIVRQPGLLGLLREFRRGDVIHLAGPSLLPLLLVLLMRKPAVLSHHGFQAVCPNGQLFYEPQRVACPGHFMAGRYEKCWECNRGRGLGKSVRIWLATFLRRWLAQRVAANVVPTRWLARTLNLRRTTVIPHGVQDRAGSAREEKRATVSFLGRLVSTKGVHVLLEAMAELHRRGQAATLQIIGDGPERTALERQARSLGLNGCVRFCGLLPNSEIEAAIGKGIVVVPSLAGEVFGLVAAQSLMAGRAVVVSDIGPLAEVVQDAGMTFSAGNAICLADCVQELTRRPELQAYLGMRARRRAQQLFQVDRMVREHSELYSSLLQRTGWQSKNTA